MVKPICQNFTELAAYLRDIDPSAATSIAKSILERVDIPELREFVAPPPNPWVDITEECRITNTYMPGVGVRVPFAPGDGLFYVPFILTVNPTWFKESFSPSGNPTIGGGYEVALRDGKIMRRKI
jgi:hypothetical protein